MNKSEYPSRPPPPLGSPCGVMSTEGPIRMWKNVDPDELTYQKLLLKKTVETE